MMDGHEDRPKSLHHKGLAVDIRTRNVPLDLRQGLFRAIYSALNPLGFDVVIEANPPHIHIEYDPKDKESWFRLGQ